MVPAQKTYPVWIGVSNENQISVAIVNAGPGPGPGPGDHPELRPVLVQVITLSCARSWSR